MGIENTVKYKYFILANFLTKKNANNTMKYYTPAVSGIFKHRAVSLIQLALCVIQRHGIALAAR